MLYFIFNGDVLLDHSISFDAQYCTLYLSKNNGYAWRVKTKLHLQSKTLSLWKLPLRRFQSRRLLPLKKQLHPRHPLSKLPLLIQRRQRKRSRLRLLASKKASRMSETRLRTKQQLLKAMEILKM